MLIEQRDLIISEKLGISKTSKRAFEHLGLVLNKGLMEARSLRSCRDSSEEEISANSIPYKEGKSWSLTIWAIVDGCER